MVTILRQHYEQALEKFDWAKSSEESGLKSVPDAMRGNQILLSSRYLARGDLNDPWAPEILALLISQAKQLPPARMDLEMASVAEYVQMVNLIAQDAHSGDAVQIMANLKDLKEFKAYPRNKEQILSLIESEKRVQSLSSVFHFCCDVEALYNPKPILNGDEIVLPQPKQGEISRLRNRLQEIDGKENCRALKTAKVQLDEMEKVFPKGPLYAEPIGIVLPQPKQGEISRLRSRLQEIDRKENYRALKTANVQLDEMQKAFPKGPLYAEPAEPSISVEAAQISSEAPSRQGAVGEESAQWGGRAWVCIAATAVIAVALGIILTNRVQ